MSEQMKYWAANQHPLEQVNTSIMPMAVIKYT